VEERAALPDGREAAVRIGVPDDPYVEQRELETVSLELHVDGERVAVLNTVLAVEADGDARALAREIASKLESGELEPSAGALEPLATGGPERPRSAFRPRRRGVAARGAPTAPCP
jgi:hypothetical protein